MHIHIYTYTYIYSYSIIYTNTHTYTYNLNTHQRASPVQDHGRDRQRGLAEGPQRHAASYIMLCYVTLYDILL